ncbi:hypothetical protein H0O03_01245 [Candidatus Micrarchaeota archaeon]|nr:hypothetical protein [Candidatus Micrarchaeota archaeon]
MQDAAEGRKKLFSKRAALKAGFEKGVSAKVMQDKVACLQQSKSRFLEVILFFENRQAKKKN